jgi:protein TonB
MVGYCAIAAALRLATAIRISQKRHNASKMMRAPSLLVSIILHGAVVAAVAWWAPMKRGGMPGEGKSTAEFTAVLLDSSSEAAEEAPAADFVPPAPANLEPEPETQRTVDLVSPPVIASETFRELPAPSIGVLDLTASNPATKPSRPMSRSKRSSIGLAGSRSGGGGGNGKYTPPHYARCPAPSYPSKARDAHQSGLALLRVMVDADGAVVSVALARSSGSRILDSAALSTVRTWRFLPAQLDRKPVSAEVEVPVRFVL